MISLIFRYQCPQKKKPTILDVHLVLQVRYPVDEFKRVGMLFSTTCWTRLLGME